MATGVDIGGTFTDFVRVADGKLQVHKRPSTPAVPSRALLAGLHELGATSEPVAHGSTVATNTILERRGARTALITTAGFRDVLTIGRQDRPHIYDWTVHPPEPLVSAEWRLEVAERVDARGAVLQALAPAEAATLAERIASGDIESVAICLLFSFLNPAHERMLGQALLRHPELFVSLSSDVLPEFREFERTSTTVLNAYVAPRMSRYLRALEGSLENPGQLRIMQSSGGTISAGLAAQQPVRTVLSGPAAGVVGAFALARRAGFDHVITLDMGGTSTDVALCAGELQHSIEGSIADWPVGVPMLDIHTVGAGGGSIASIDPGGALRVGPQSAGAEPGPACYQRGGDQPTVTDAHLVLGRLLPDHFLDGGMRLVARAAHAALHRLAGQMGATCAQVAQGVLRVANAAMERAIRVISVERGHDPREFTLVAFGGAGPMHACALAEALHIPRVLVPRHPGLTSALGLLLADVVKDTSRTILCAAADLDDQELEELFVELRREAEAEWRAEGLPADPAVVHSLDVRYRGQSYELNAPYAGDLAATERDYHRLHERRFGHSRPDRPLEIVTLRLRLRAATPPVDLSAPETPSDGAVPRLFSHQADWGDGPTETFVYGRTNLGPGATLDGPALVVQLDTTVAIPPGWRARVDADGNLLLTHAA